MAFAGTRQAHDPLAPPAAGRGQEPAPLEHRRDRRRYRNAPQALIEDYRRLAMTADAVAASLGAIGACLARFWTAVDAGYLLISLLLPLGWLSIVATQRGYDRRFLGTGPEEYRRILHSGVLLFTALAVLSFSLAGELSRGYVAVVVPGTVALTLLARHGLRDWVFRLRARGCGLQRVLVVGRADATVALIEKFDREPQHGLMAVGACVPQEGADPAQAGVGEIGQILAAVDQTGAHAVAVVSHPDLSGQTLRRLSWALEERNVELIVSPGIIEVAGPRLSIRPVAGLSLLHLERPSAHGGKMLLKAGMDRLAGALLLVLSLPLLAGIALAVRLSGPGPVLYRQTRIGAGNRPFTMLKFRTMVADADRQRELLRLHDEGNGMLFKIRDDPRVTRVGAVLRRFSLDELPQMLNVVRGQMSLVGPRPPLPEEVAAYSADAVRRLRVRPGMTGLWQVSGRSDLSWEESLRLDLRYVDNWSIALDVSILWRTCRAVLRGAGAY